MAGSTIGAQMYTLRDHLKTPADIAATCKKVREMGYEAIQVSAFGPIDPPDLAKILDSEGLTCAATHVGLDMMKDVQKCLDYHNTLKCKYTAIGGHNTDSKANWVEFAKTFTDIADKLAEHGLTVGYHNHSHELMRYEGETALDLLIENCGQSVWFEVDTYWIAHGGGDPAAYIEKVGASGADRLPCVHYKDMVMGEGRTHKMCEVGTGNLNWPRINDACKKANVKWYLVERDSGDLDPFESLKISFDNMKAMGIN